MPRRGRKALVGPVEDMERRARERGYEYLALCLRLDWLTRASTEHDLEECMITRDIDNFD